MSDQTTCEPDKEFSPTIQEREVLSDWAKNPISESLRSVQKSGYAWVGWDGDIECDFESIKESHPSLDLDLLYDCLESSRIMGDNNSCRIEWGATIDKYLEACNLQEE